MFIQCCDIVCYLLPFQCFYVQMHDMIQQFLNFCMQINAVMRGELAHKNLYLTFSKFKNVINDLPLLKKLICISNDTDSQIYNRNCSFRIDFLDKIYLYRIYYMYGLLIYSRF